MFPQSTFPMGRRISIEPKHRGAVNELRATAWLIGLGYEVCRNVSQHGPVDLVAIRGDEVILIDVKATQLRNDGTTRLYRRRTPLQMARCTDFIGVRRQGVLGG